MKLKSDCFPDKIYKLQQMKHVIQDIKKQLLEIDQHLRKIQQNYPSFELEQAKMHSHSHENNSKTFG